MPSPMGLVKKQALTLASWRQRLCPDTTSGWVGALRHLKASAPRNRHMFWAVCVWLLALHLSHLMAKSDDASKVWGPPVEPPGSVIVTSGHAQLSTDGVQRPDRADARVVLQSGEVGVAEAKAEVASGERLPSGLRVSLHQWSDAWRRQDVAAYLDMYAPDFVPSSGISRQAWAQSRTRRITEKNSIRHEMHDLKVQTTASTTVMTFTQIYQDERIKLTDQKTMHWVQRDGLWLIALEKTN